MRAKSNQFFASTLAVVFGSLVMVSGPVAMAQPPPPSGPTPECQVGDTQEDGLNARDTRSRPGVHQGTAPKRLKNPPVGPSGPIVAERTIASVPSVTV